jgi:hypothetical protein
MSTSIKHSFRALSLCCYYDWNKDVIKYCNRDLIVWKVG